MRFLMDSRGDHIASVIDRRLYSAAGDNIGHYLPELAIFIDQSGRYLGEIVSDDRLMYGVASGHKSVGFAVAGDYGSIGRCGGPVRRSDIGRVDGFADIAADRLK
jgi:hypothetical protein